MPVWICAAEMPHFSDIRFSKNPVCFGLGCSKRHPFSTVPDQKTNFFPNDLFFCQRVRFKRPHILKMCFFVRNSFLLKPLKGLFFKTLIFIDRPVPKTPIFKPSALCGTYISLLYMSSPTPPPGLIRDFSDILVAFLYFDFSLF